MTSRTAFLIASIVIACVCADARVDTQTQSQDVTAALLTEVRALRTTIALAVAAGASGQLALGRLQLQEQRVNALMTRLDTTREMLAEASITTGFKNCLSLHESRCAPAARVDSLANSALRIVEEAQFRAGVNNREEW